MSSGVNRCLCPRCRAFLQTVPYRGVELDHCPHCGGTWLDAGEAARAIGVSAEPAIWLSSRLDGLEQLSGLACPRDRTELIEHLVSFAGRGVEVDVCPACAGLWLDAGECLTLRDLVHEGGQHPEMGLAPKPTAMSYLFQLFTALPLEVWHPLGRRPLVTTFLLALNALAFVPIIAGEVSDPGTSRVAVQALGLVPVELWRGAAPLALVTHLFLHFNWVHLLGNLWFLRVFGDNVEDALEQGRFLLLYLAAGLAGALAHVTIYPSSEIPLGGASGAVAGLMGAYVALFPRAKVYTVIFFMRFRLPALTYLGLWFLLQLLSMLARTPANGGGIAWDVHVVGFLTGLAFGHVYRARPLSFPVP
ncbi:MAG: rhomboid family intramembrane serine protease [Candidatus Schekmanbacteria bacterium]|nr:rhomboid family intramembrane serine protease [Candidatus Schekmanbacteria bacterium]